MSDADRIREGAGQSTILFPYIGLLPPESKAEGYRKPVGHFPFDTRKQETEESYGGFTPLSWQHNDSFSQLSTRELMRAYSRVVKMRDRIPKKFFENFLERI